MALIGHSARIVGRIRHRTALTSKAVWRISASGSCRRIPPDQAGGRPLEQRSDVRISRRESPADEPCPARITFARRKPVTIIPSVSTVTFTAPLLTKRYSNQEFEIGFDDIDWRFPAEVADRRGRRLKELAIHARRDQSTRKPRPTSAFLDSRGHETDS